MYAHLSNSRKLCRQTCCTPQKHTDWKMKKALLSGKNRSAEIVSPAWIRRLFCLFYKLSRTKMLLIPEHILVQDLKCAKAEDEALKCRWGCVKSNIISWTPFDRNREESRGYLRDGLHLLLLCVGSSAVQHLEEVWRLGSHTCVNVGLRKRRDMWFNANRNLMMLSV